MQWYVGYIIYLIKGDVPEDGSHSIRPHLCSLAKRHTHVHTEATLTHDIDISYRTTLKLIRILMRYH